MTTSYCKAIKRLGQIHRCYMAKLEFPRFADAHTIFSTHVRSWNSLTLYKYLASSKQESWLNFNAEWHSPQIGNITRSPSNDLELCERVTQVKKDQWINKKNLSHSSPPSTNHVVYVDFQFSHFFPLVLPPSPAKSWIMVSFFILSLMLNFNTDYV